MPTLNWIGKNKVVNHHQDVIFKVLEHKYNYKFGIENSELNNSGNKIIHGDNLEALKSILPEYEGKIKCIYIDPPYNTGNEKWVYNDNVNHPKIKKWLGDVVGKQGEDLTRHDKWLCMMYPRIKILHKLLRQDGAIFISIDDNEQASLKLMMDEIFGGNNFIANIIWRGGKRNAAKYISTSHEYMLFYVKKKAKIAENNINWKIIKSGIDDIYKKEKMLRKTFKDDYEKMTLELKKWYKELPQSNSAKDHKHYKYFDKTGIFCSDNISRVCGGKYSIKNPITGNIIKPPSRGWVWGNEDDFWKAYAKKIIIFSENDKLPILKRYLHNNELQILDTVFYKDRRAATKTLKNIFDKNIFEFPKDVSVISFFLQAISTPNSIILDSFAGSGTTAHAVLNLNKEDGGNRKFIMIEMEDYAETITAERVKRVINGYGTGKKAVAGTGGSFDYYELGKPIFKKDKNLNEEIGEQKIREYIYYTETKQHLTRSQDKKYKYLLDIFNNTGYYFYYEPKRLTNLDTDTLNIVAQKSEQYIIYADICKLDKSYMLEKNIIFKKIPRDIKRF